MSSITSVTLDKASYVPGEPMVLTAVGNWANNVTATFTLSDGTTGTASAVVVPAAAVTDNDGRSWTVESNTGTQAVATAVA